MGRERKEGPRQRDPDRGARSGLGGGETGGRAQDVGETGASIPDGNLLPGRSQGGVPGRGLARHRRTAKRRVGWAPGRV